MILPKFIEIEDENNQNYCINIANIALVSDNSTYQQAIIHLNVSHANNAIAIHCKESYQEIMDKIEEASKITTIITS